MVKRKARKKSVRKEVNNSKRKSPPLGVLVIVILNFLFALLLILLAISYPGPGGILLLMYSIPAVICFFVGFFLWKGKNWARICEVILFMPIIFSLSFTGSDNIVWASLLVALVSIVYLFASDKAREHFSSH